MDFLKKYIWSFEELNHTMLSLAAEAKIFLALASTHKLIFKKHLDMISMAISPTDPKTASKISSSSVSARPTFQSLNIPSFPSGEQNSPEPFFPSVISASAKNIKELLSTISL